MQVCGFWLASGKKHQMALGDSSLIWIQGISLESEGTNPSAVSDCLRTRRLYDPWNSAGKKTGVAAFPFSRGSSKPRGRTQVSA